jgi:hypothetical protein
VDARATSDTTFHPNDGTPFRVEGHGLLADGARSSTHAALRAVEGDALLRPELQGGHSVAFPSPFGNRERLGGARSRTRHIVTRDARLDIYVDQRSASRKSRSRWRLDDGRHWARVETITAPRARGKECHFVEGTRRTKVPLLHHARFRPLRNRVGDAPDGRSKERAAVALASGQKIGWRLTSHRNSDRLIPCFLL